MVFKTIDGHLTTIFSKVQNVNSGFDLTSNVIGDIVDKFNNFNTNQEFGENWTNFLDGIKNENVADFFKDLAKQGASAKASVEDVYAAILNGNTRGIGNVKSIISIFNSLDKDKQEALAKAVGQTNVQFGKYLENVKDGKASLGGYAKQLVATTAKTIGLQLATIALNLAVSAVIGAIMWGVSKVINQMSDLKAEIDNLKSELDDTRSEIEDINSTLDENKKKIEEINQNPLNITNKETLTTLQLENVELERQKKLLEEIEKQKAKELNDTTVEYLNKKSELNTDGGYWKSVWNNIINPDSFIDDFKQIFDKNTTWGEKILNIDKFLNPLGNVVDTFLPETRSILDETEAFQNELDGKFREVEAIFSNGISADTDFNAFSTVTADINELRDKLTANIDTLNTYKGSLSETSDEYKTVSEQLEKYLSQLEILQAIESYDTSGLTDEYFKIKEKFDNGFNAVLAFTDGLNVDESLTKLMNVKTNQATGNQYYSLVGNYLEQFEQAERLLDKFNEIQLTRELTFDEQNIKQSVESYYEALNKEIQKYGETYASGKNSEASIIFSNYLKDNSIENISEETYSAWKNGLLKQANGDTEITDTLLRMVSAVAPQIENVIDEKKYNTTTSAVNELSNSFVTLRESINKTSETKNTFDSALKTIKDGGSLSYDDVWALVDVDNSLADKFTRTANGYIIALDELNEAKEKYNETNVALIQDEIDSVINIKNTAQTNIDTYIKMRDKLLSSGIKSTGDVALLDKYNKLIEDESNNLDKVNTTLSESNLLLQEYYAQNSDVTAIIETFDKQYEELSKAVSSYTSSQKDLNSALEEQKEYGQLSASTMQSLIEAGYAQALVVDKETGAVTLNTSAMEQLNNQKKLSIMLDAQKQRADLIKTLDEEKSKVDELKSSLMSSNEEKKKGYVQDLLAHSENIKYIEEQIAMYDAMVASVGSPVGFDGKEEPESVKQFKKALAKKEHLLNTNQITEQEYYDWLDSESKRVYGNLKDYEEDLWKYEEQVYKWRQEQEEKLFDKKIENYKKLSDNALNKYVNGNGAELTVNASFDYARSQINSAITETQNRINELSLKTGFEDEIEELTSELEDLYDTLDDINKHEIESQKEYISSLKDEYSDLMDEQIDQQKELADSINEAYENQIKTIDKQIDAIKKVNEAEERQNDILKARQELQKASVKNRLVLVGNGQWEARRDEEAYQDAQKNLNEALQDEQIAKLEEQKDFLEEQKNNSKEYYDKVIEDLENQKTAREKQYDILVDIYEQLGGERKQTSLNESLIEKLTANGDINKAVQNLTPSEIKQAIESGLLTVDSDGNYAIDYEKILNKSSDDIEKIKNDTSKLTEILSGNIPETTENSNSSETIKSTSEKNKTTKLFDGYNSNIKDILRDIFNGKISIQGFANIANTMMDNNIQRNIQKDISASSYFVNNNNNVSSTFNITNNFEGNPDDNAVNRFTNKLEQQLSVYTQKLTSEFTKAITNQRYSRN